MFVTCKPGSDTPMPDAVSRVPFLDEATSRVYLLAGDPRRALPFAERASRSCTALDQPVEVVVAHLRLGAALEALGDRRACDAYAAVLQHWGAVRASTSAAEARAAVTRLQCAIAR